MSTGATLSPSPVHFGDRTNNILNPNPPHYNLVSNNNSQSSSRATPFYERRRTSHPHNEPLQRFADAMSNHRSQSILRSQASIIDLTDDSDELPAPAPPPPPRVRERSHSHRPPQLGRSDAVGFGAFIDLTEDNEPDLIITGVQPRQHPRPPPRVPSPQLFIPESNVPPRNLLGQWRGRGDNGELQRQLPPIRGMGAVLHAAQDFIMNRHNFFNVGVGNGNLPNHIAQAMPQMMDYEAVAFGGPPRRPEYTAPPEPQVGFTRSPLEKDVIICPSCEEELVHNKNEDNEPPLKKNGKAPSRKEREEHPFWVLKDCGHVSVVIRTMLAVLRQTGLLQSLLSKQSHSR